MDTEVGRVLYANTAEFAFGCHAGRSRDDLPAFGALVRAEGARAAVYGLVYDVRVNDDPLVRQLVATPNLQGEYVEDQRQNRQVPVEIVTLAVGYRAGGRITRSLPPQPPLSLDSVCACADAELTEFSERHDYFALLLGGKMLVPAEELLAAHLRLAAAARPETERRAFLVRAGRELARLLAGDMRLLDAILRRMKG